MEGVEQKDNMKILGTDSLVKMDSEKTDLDRDFLLELNKGRSDLRISFLVVEEMVHEVSEIYFLKGVDRVHEASGMSFLMVEDWDLCIPFHVFVTCVFSMAISSGTL